MRRDILLRAPELEDIEFMMDIENSEEALDAGCTATGLYSRYQIRKFITDLANDIFTDRQMRMVICLPDGEAAGMIDVFDFNPRHSRAEVGIVVKDTYRHQGIAETALCMVCGHCFNRLGIHQLYAYISEDNKACLRTFQREGFETVGLLKDWMADGREFKSVWLVQKTNNKM